MAIDIGAAAIDRSSYGSSWYSRLELANPANASGTINTVEVWAYSDLSNFKVGTLWNVSGDDYKCRDVEEIGSVTAGSKQTFSGLDMDVETGDVIGCYIPSGGGSIERDTSGGAGNYYLYHDDGIVVDEQNTWTYSANYAISLYGTGTEGGGATEKTGSDTGAGADARASGNPLAAIGGSETGSGADLLPARDIALPDSGSGADAFVSLQMPQAKTSSDAGSGAEAVPVYSAVLADIESGSGIEVFIARLLAAAEAGYGAEASEIGGGGLLKHLFASELGEGTDGLTAKIEIPTKGGGMKLWT